MDEFNRGLCMDARLRRSRLRDRREFSEIRDDRESAYELASDQDQTSRLVKLTAIFGPKVTAIFGPIAVQQKVGTHWQEPFDFESALDCLERDKQQLQNEVWAIDSQIDSLHAIMLGQNELLDVG